MKKINKMNINGEIYDIQDNSSGYITGEEVAKFLPNAYKIRYNLGRPNTAENIETVRNIINDIENQKNVTVLYEFNANEYAYLNHYEIRGEREIHFYFIHIETSGTTGVVDGLVRYRIINVYKITSYNIDNENASVHVSTIKTYSLENNANLSTKDYVDTKFAEALAMGFKVEVVEALPTENISHQVIYLVLNGDNEENNIYDEFVYNSNDEWEKIGSTKTDLSNYYNKQEVDEKIEYAKTVVLNMNTPIKLGASSTQFVTLNDTDKELLRQWLNNFLKSDKETEYVVFIFTPLNNSVTKYPFTGVIFREQVETGSFRIYCNELVNHNGNPRKEHIQISFGYNINDNEITTFNTCTVIVSRSFFMFADNNYSYDVTQDYNPAHKKYVDDSFLEKSKELFKTIPVDFDNITDETKSILLEPTINYIENNIPFAIYDIIRNKFLYISNKLINNSISFSYLTADTLAGTTYKGFEIWWETDESGNYSITRINTPNYRNSNWFLSVNNNNSYTPTSNYNPATKKYVDDSITTALGDVNTILATLTTVEESEVSE